MKSAYLFLVASAALVTCKPQRSKNDIIWYPVDGEDGVFVSLYGEKRRTSSDSKWRSHRRARYSGMEDYNPSSGNDDPSFFYNIHERRTFGQQNGFQWFNNQPSQQLVAFGENRFPQRPDYQGLNDENLQEIINEVFEVNKYPGQRPSSENNIRPSTTTTSRPFQRPTDSEWFKPQRPRPSRPNNPTDSLIFPGESSRPTTASSNEMPTETTTMTPCERLCQVTPEFNPVCGSDSVTYTNLGRLKCAQACGKGVTLAHFGNCGRTRTSTPLGKVFF